MKDDIVQETQTYINTVIEELKERLDIKFEESMRLLLGIRNLLKSSTSRLVLKNVSKKNQYKLFNTKQTNRQPRQRSCNPLK